MPRLSAAHTLGNVLPSSVGPSDVGRMSGRVMIEFGDRRSSVRRPVVTAATIELEFGQKIDCSTINIYERGVKLLLLQEVDLPGEFRVSVPGERVRRRRARMIWRNGLELGVQFL